MTLYSRIFCSLLFLCSIVPVGNAQEPDQIDRLLQATGMQQVTRGSFVRAAVEVLDIEDNPSAKIPYKRVPRSLLPSVRAAYNEGALQVFGNDLTLGRSITRGQAVQVLADLLDLEAEGDVNFTDVRSADPSYEGVRIAIDKGWIAPLRERRFGLRSPLRAVEAKVLLRKVMIGASQLPSVSQSVKPLQQKETIRVNVAGKRIGSLPKTQILESMWKIIQERFLYDEDIDPDEAAYAMAEAMVESLGDKYTNFLRPAQAKSFKTRIKGEVSGIGAQVEHLNGIVTIVTPIKSSPAERAGLKPGDEIMSVDGEDITDMGFLDAVELVRGPKGSTVKLGIRRNGAVFNVSVTRDVIKVPELIQEQYGDVHAIEIVQFGEVTLRDFRNAIEEIGEKNPKGVIVDLRNNPGGLLDAAISVISAFVEQGSAAIEVRGRSGTSVTRTTLPPVLSKDIPVVVLINEGSASASEVVAGALRDHDRATLVGKKSFGKGTVQEVLQFTDKSNLKITRAEWYTPNGKKINGKGVTPDKVIENYDDNDRQLKEALRLLR